MLRGHHEIGDVSCAVDFVMGAAGSWQMALLGAQNAGG
jgi:hypothetical protein